MSDEMTMSVSPICERRKKRYAFVRFTDGKKTCEWRIPEARLSANDGFSKDEIEGLRLYVQSNMTQLKKMAAGINLFEAFKNG